MQAGEGRVDYGCDEETTVYLPVVYQVRQDCGSGHKKTMADKATGMLSAGGEAVPVGAEQAFPGYVQHSANIE